MTGGNPRPAADRPLLEIQNLSKTFFGNRALDGVDLSIGQQEVHALIGANGSGKSTLIKILAGYHRADEGSIGSLLGDDLALHTNTPRDARIRFVHQDLGLILQLSAMDNLALSRSYRTRFGAIRWRAQRDAATRLLARFGADFDVSRPLFEATPVQRVVVAVAAALDGWVDGPCLLVLDEPTAVLPAHEVDSLFEILHEIKALGASVLYVSHRLDELERIADRVSVLRGGRRVLSAPITDLDVPALATSMVGEEFHTDVPDRAVAATDRQTVALAARQVCGRYLRDASFDLKEGEILGLAGLPGSGHDELPYIVAGHGGPTASGELRTGDGADVGWVSIRTTRRQLPLVPRDRATEAVFAQWSVRENLVLPVLDRFTRRGVVRRRDEVVFSEGWIDRFGVVSAGIEANITTLSGGNQQKLIIARALSADEPVVVMCEPTAGVDIGARAAIYRLIVQAAEGGRSVLVSSSDEGDLVALCDRVVVFRDGKPAAELTGNQITRSAIVGAMEGYAG